jgi:hypothetical protein
VSKNIRNTFTPPTTKGLGQAMHGNVKQGVCHTVALPFRLKSILGQKKKYGNSNISPCKNIILQKIL